MLITNFNFGPCRESQRHNCSNFDFDSFRESQPGFIIQILHSITSLIQNECELCQKIELTATAWFLDNDSQRLCEVGRSPELSYISLMLWASNWLAFPTCPEISHDPWRSLLQWLPSWSASSGLLKGNSSLLPRSLHLWGLHGCTETAWRKRRLD